MCLSNLDLNLLDWSVSNSLAVVLGRAVYLWSASTGDIRMLMSLEGADEYVSSIKWVPDGQHIAVGNSNAEVQVSEFKERRFDNVQIIRFTNHFFCNTTGTVVGH